jgi:hypothetical protein
VPKEMHRSQARKKENGGFGCARSLSRRGALAKKSKNLTSNIL